MTNERQTRSEVPPLELQRSPARVPQGSAPILMVVVDTEEEFDWNANFDRKATGVTAMREIHRAQEACDEFGVRPVYVVDYPVSSDAHSVETLSGFADDGRAEIGAHLHPWVNPPHQEAVTRYHSFAGNLPGELEREKLAALGSLIEQAFGRRPEAYKAGRYGIGPRTADILEELGYYVDLSPCPPFDFRSEGGPDYSGFSCDPYWFGNSRRLLGVPSTAAYVGHLSRMGAGLYEWAHRSPWASFKVPGILARTGALSRLRLSPEGFTGDEMRRLTEDLLLSGLRIFVLSFHSPSMAPGFTPYVSSTYDRDAFLAKLRGYFDFFLSTLGGRSMTASELRRFLLIKTESESP